MEIINFHCFTLLCKLNLSHKCMHIFYDNKLWYFFFFLIKLLTVITDQYRVFSPFKNDVCVINICQILFFLSKNYYERLYQSIPLDRTKYVTRPVVKSRVKKKFTPKYSGKQEIIITYSSKNM